MLSSVRTATARARAAVRLPTSPRSCPVSSRALRPVQRLYSTGLDQVSTLANGIRVATEAPAGHFSGIGVYIDAGSRYEDESLSGLSHIVDRLAFKSTNQRTANEMLEAIESLGGNVQCASSREALIYQSATFNDAVEATTALLAETIRDPVVTDEEVHQQLETADYEIGEIWSKPELILPELVHMAGFKDNTLGRPLLCPKERLGQIDRYSVDAYRRQFFRPDRIVVAFAGTAHADAVRLAERYFGDMKTGDGAPLPSINKSLRINPDQSPLTAAAHYTGGFLELPNLPAPPNPAYPRLSHIYVAFEGLPIDSDDIYTLATLQTLLGGGGSFSAGGPGKGMYSRLYTNVLNQHAWVESCTAFNHSYNDSGLFGIAASCLPTHVTPMLDVICRELAVLTGELNSSTSFPRSLSKTEVARAKNQLKSGLLMNLESRMVELEDLGRQVQVHGRKVGPAEMCSRIDSITVDDLHRVAKKVFGGRVDNKGVGTGCPTVVLQEAAPENQRLLRSFYPSTKKTLGWGEIQERIARWGLGRQ